MLKANQPNGFVQEWEAAWKEPAPSFGSCHRYRQISLLCSFSFSQNRPASLSCWEVYFVCVNHPTPQRTGLGQAHGSPDTERSGAGAMPVLRRTPVSRACRAPRWHRLATTWAWACSFLTPATQGQLPFSPKARIIEQ